MVSASERIGVSNFGENGGLVEAAGIEPADHLAEVASAQRIGGPSRECDAPLVLAHCPADGLDRRAAAAYANLCEARVN